jgi:Short C-terminal domain
MEMTRAALAVSPQFSKGTNEMMRRRGVGIVGVAAVAHHASAKGAQQQAAADQQAADQQTIADQQAAIDAQAVAAPASAADPQTAQLENLASLHAQGILTDEEFAAAKAKALGI